VVTVVVEPRRISNSEVGTWLTCRYKYYLSFVKRIAPKQMGTALGKGTLGHEVLAIYYQRLMDGVGHEAAKHDAVNHLMYIMAGSETYALDTCTEVRRILELYWAYYTDDELNWEILAVEKSYDLDLTDGYGMPMRLDLLVKDRDGKIALVDHKFFYDMPNTDKLALNVQFPKYIGALRHNDIQVDYCVLNVLRTRSMKNPALNDLFRRINVGVSAAKVRNALRTHILASEEITEYRSLPEGAQEAKALPLMNDYVCKSCDFAPICITNFDGGDPTYLIQSDYVHNTYGYNDTPNVEELM
jgi:peptidyl-tRNA hydrolase